jgi:hypothetical protein
MTVRELREKLQEFDDDLPVILYGEFDLAVVARVEPHLVYPIGGEEYETVCLMREEDEE